MRRLAQLDERFDPVQTERGKKWNVLADMRTKFEQAWTPLRDAVRARKAQDEPAAEAAVSEFLSAWKGLQHDVEQLRQTFQAVD